MYDRAPWDAGERKLLKPWPRDTTLGGVAQLDEADWVSVQVNFCAVERLYVRIQGATRVFWIGAVVHMDGQGLPIVGGSTSTGKYQYENNQHHSCPHKGRDTGC